MKVLIDLPEKNLMKLQKDADVLGRSRKKHIELLLIQSTTPQLQKQSSHGVMGILEKNKAIQRTINRKTK